jgi:hypothetical protein
MNLTEDPHTGVSAIEALGDRLARRAREPNSWADAPHLLLLQERALLDLSASWCGVASSAAPTIAGLRHRDHRTGAPSIETGLSREQEVQLISILHDVSADLTAAARSCRNARSIVEPLVGLRLRSANETS